ncbi:MAG: tRNA-wybutosine modification methyltransferase TYW3 [Candidatus Njordarchaeales archaeon]
METFRISREFIQRKKVFIRRLSQAIERGEVDEDIIPLLNMINLLPFAYTTSSCSGRILLIDIPYTGSKKDSVKVARWHSPVKPDVVWNILENYEPKGIVWLKLEGMIVAVAVSSIDWASFFIKLARFLGFKDSGIRAINHNKGHVIMDFTSTEKMYLPVATKFNGLLVEKEYLYRIIDIANNLLERTKNRMKRLLKALSVLHEIICRERIIEPSKINFKHFRECIEKK